MNDMSLTAEPAEALELAPEERQPCEIWTRVMGYHRPVGSFNRGKKGEFAERVSFREPARADD
ncbi:anaerobic ribonucleoside-triphosphate reductase [Consotaella aegiceratis]|uniref:anaerobic ribonucleoside-triphosphate reductase n=1 Tax=Consotaella aegiceratis TaxID=3097961 RepID=UPI002F41BC76